MSVPDFFLKKILFTRIKSGTCAKTECRKGFLSPSMSDRDKVVKQCPTPPRKASSFVWRALQLQGNMHYKAGALE